jgi:hypothetical protein
MAQMKWDDIGGEWDDIGGEWHRWNGTILAENGTDEMGRMAQMMNSHKLLIGEPERKTIFDCEGKIKTATKGIGCENVVWINVGQNWSPVAYFCEQPLAQS